MNTNELQQYFAQQAIDDRNQTQGMSCLIETSQIQAEEQHAIECGFHDDWVDAQRQINLYI